MLWRHERTLSRGPGEKEKERKKKDKKIARKKKVTKANPWSSLVEGGEGSYLPKW